LDPGFGWVERWPLSRRRELQDGIARYGTIPPEDFRLGVRRNRLCHLLTVGVLRRDDRRIIRWPSRKVSP
jgi:hypothetical protein